MKVLAISGSARRNSTNTAMLEAIRQVAAPRFDIRVFHGIGALPVFSPDLEGEATPRSVRDFMEAIEASDGLIVSSPEYVRTLPGGLKNAIDWLVSAEVIVNKPVVLAHASHRGDDMLATLRTVMSTVTSNFNGEIFLRFPLMKETPEAIRQIIATAENRSRVDTFLKEFSEFCQSVRADVLANGRREGFGCL